MLRSFLRAARALAVATLLLALCVTGARGQASAVPGYKPVADRIIAAALDDSAAWHRLAELSDRFGPRLSGSRNLEQALDWIIEEMRKDGLQNVRGEPVMVPHWERGVESAAMLEPRPQELRILGLGGTIATSAEGVTGEVLVVGSFEDLKANADRARGRIVLWDVPFTNYGATVQYRNRGAIEAAKVGAIASLLRSVGPFGMQTPHTGAMSYDSTIARIPHVAVTMEDAMMMRRMQERGQRIVVNVRTGGRWLPDAPSRNVVAEIVGSEKPEEIVVLGGHSDSWDVGQGAMDDAGGCIAAWEAVRLMKELGLRPRRTVRVALWVNEENGLRGGVAYARAHDPKQHVLAIESDGGVFQPLGFGIGAGDAAFQVLSQVGKLLEPIGAGRIVRGGGGADIGPLMREGVPGAGLNVEGERYFWYHHTHADTVDKLDPAELAKSAAAMAILAYVVADLPERLPAN